MSRHENLRDEPEAMLHIATVHYKTPRWIPIQTRELQRHLDIPYRTWTSLEGIDPSYGRYFDTVIEQGGNHADKLNHLAIEIAHDADDGDLLMFLDGDAFPIANPGPLIASGLREAPLMAVRRAENGNDLQPHPCFCVTHVGTWRTLPGDWTKGYLWPGIDGAPTSDVGANLLRQLDLTGTPWREVLRTNRNNPHPLFFGIYGDTIYHHGAGFRWPSARIESANVSPIPTIDLPLVGPIARRVGRVRQRAQRRSMMRRNMRQSEEMFRRIQRDDRSWLDELM
jgi:hypothetical protein